jgi:urease accessory protein
MTRRLLASTAALALAALPALAFAHVGEQPHDHGASLGLAAGFLHPFSGLDHLAAMLAVGLWSALTQTGRRMLAAPFAFAGLLLVGALIGATGVAGALPGVEPLVAASVLVLGLTAAMRWSLSTGASAALVGAFAVFHGLAHGAELGGGAALIGMVAATALLHAGGLALGLRLRAAAPAWSRAAGGTIALLGLGLLTRLVVA